MCQAEVGHQHHGRLVPPLVEGFANISPGESAAEQQQHEDKAVEADTQDQDLVWGKCTDTDCISGAVTFKYLRKQGQSNQCRTPGVKF